jgi:hypothetical protein
MSSIEIYKREKREKERKRERKEKEISKKRETLNACFLARGVVRHLRKQFFARQINNQRNLKTIFIHSIFYICLNF